VIGDAVLALELIRITSVVCSNKRFREFFIFSSDLRQFSRIFENFLRQSN